MPQLRCLCLCLISSLVGFSSAYWLYRPVPKIQPTTTPLLADRHPLISQFKLIHPQADIVMVGDSITDSGRWNEMFPELHIANRGVSGHTTQDVLNRIDSIVNTKAGKAFVMLGINDILRGVELKVTQENYRQIVQQLKQQHMQVFIQSTIDCDPSRGREARRKIKQLNRFLQQLAHEENLTFIDLNQKLANQNGLKSIYSSDGVHLLGSGYLVWQQMLLPYVN